MKASEVASNLRNRVDPEVVKVLIYIVDNIATIKQELARLHEQDAEIIGITMEIAKGMDDLTVRLLGAQKAMERGKRGSEEFLSEDIDTAGREGGMQ